MNWEMGNAWNTLGRNPEGIRESSKSRCRRPKLTLQCTSYGWDMKNFEMLHMLKESNKGILEKRVPRLRVSRFYVLRAVLLKMEVFCNGAQCRLVANG